LNLEMALFVGLQGSGKSTFYRARLAATHALVSKDLMRNRPNRSRRQAALVREWLSSGRSVVVDNTNPAAADREPLIRLAREFGATVTGYYFATPLARCLERNRAREGRARVPDVALFATRKRMQLPSYDEGFDRLYQVDVKEGPDFDVREWPRPNQD
jgi:predicted kinase